MRLSILVLVLLLTACATPYQKQGALGGFSETQLDVNVFQVTFKGNAYTDRERSIDYTLLRSAELALENGYNYFVTIDSSKYSETSSYTTPTTTYGSATAYGNTAYGSATTYGGQTFYMSKPTVSNTIVCFKEKPENAFSYNAEFIKTQLSKKYLVGEYDPKSTLSQKPANNSSFTNDISGTYSDNYRKEIKLKQVGSKISGSIGHYTEITGTRVNDSVSISLKNFYTPTKPEIAQLDISSDGLKLVGTWRKSRNSTGRVWELTRLDENGKVIPQSKPKISEKPKTAKIDESKSQDVFSYMGQAEEEINQKSYDKNLWAKSLVIANGDEKRRKAIYIELRAKQLSNVSN